MAIEFETTGRIAEDSSLFENNETGIVEIEADVQVAQASDDVQPVDAAPDGTSQSGTSAAEVPAEFIPDSANVVRLPANVSLENAVVSGQDLLLTQPDGSIITIKNCSFRSSP